MNFNIFLNYVLNNENGSIKNFFNNLSKGDKPDDAQSDNRLYQVVDISVDGAYLLDTANNITTKETNIPKKILDKLNINTVLSYKKGKYVIEQELTKQFKSNVTSIEDFEKIKNTFSEQSNILSNDPNTRYKLEVKGDDYCILSYDDNKIQVPTPLIPFWARVGENLSYEKDTFKRDL